jgi:hypothetical protein
MLAGDSGRSASEGMASTPSRQSRGAKAWSAEGEGMAGKFVLKKSGNQYMFNLKAGYGEIIATSERYTTT